MEKGISAFIATVLLIGFTVAVGAILSVWFTTFTRTQTTAVQAGAACVANPVYVRALSLTDGTLTLLINNAGPDSVTVTSLIVTCDGKIAASQNPGLSIDANSQTTTDVTLTLTDCTQGNLGVSLTALCSRGGTTSAECREGTCFGP